VAAVAAAALERRKKNYCFFSRFMTFYRLKTCFEQKIFSKFWE
jgi:hypothetical protein